jgi:CARDB.
MITDQIIKRVSISLIVVIGIIALFSLSGAATAFVDSTTQQSETAGPVNSLSGESYSSVAQTTTQELSVNQTFITVGSIGVIQDQGTVEIGATGINNTNGPVTRDSVTFSIGSEVVASAPINNGTATTIIDPTTLTLTPGQSVSVDVVEGTVETPASVNVTHEVLGLDDGFNLLSVPQAAELVTEDVSALNVWNSETQTYETVTDPVFDSPTQLHNAVYVSATTPSARLGFVFEENQPPVPGTVELDTGFNFIGSNFAIDSLEDGDSRTLETDLVNVDVANISVFDQTLATQLDASSTIGPYQAYWVFTDSATPTRPILRSPYNPTDRQTVLGTGGENALQVTNDAPDAVRFGQNISVSATVENTGLTARDDALVSFSVDQTVLQTQTISVNAGATQTAEFTIDTSTLNIVNTTTIDHTVAVSGDKDTASLAVQVPEMAFEDQSVLNGVTTISVEQAKFIGSQFNLITHQATDTSGDGTIHSAPIIADGVPVFDEAQIQVGDQINDLALDSVSSLLNQNGQPLTDESVIAAPAAPTATNEDTDGDAVSYPSETDILLIAVDNNVVGVTGPFATSDTD